MVRPTVASTSECVRTNIAVGCILLFPVLQATGNYFKAKKETAGSDRQQRREQSVLCNASILVPYLCIYWVAQSSRKMLKNLPNQNDINLHLERCLSLAISILPNIFFLYAEPQACVAYAIGKGIGSYEVSNKASVISAVSTVG